MKMKDHKNIALGIVKKELGETPQDIIRMSI